MNLTITLALVGTALASYALAPGSDPARSGTRAASATAPVVIELFTSQGCSSCPPADRLAQKLAAEPALVVISRPVTYWDRLGWKDTLGKPENTALQRGYAGRQIDGAGVYTPQMVVDGRAGVVGSRESEVRSLVARARKIAKPTLALARKPSGLTVSVSGKSSAAADLSVIALDSQATVSIGSGENGGRKVIYSNVFKGERKLGSWSGGARTFAVPAAALSVPGADRYAAVLRQGDAGPILAARMIGPG